VDEGEHLCSQLRSPFGGIAPVAALSGLLHIVGATFVAADDADGPPSSSGLPA